MMDTSASMHRHHDKMQTARRVVARPDFSVLGDS
jgi:hypothetical protein